MAKSVIEVEIRGILTEEQYGSLHESLSAMAERKEEDDRRTVFFIIPGKTLKVASRLNLDTAKIALKLGDIVTSDFQQEFEVSISPEELDIAVSIFRSLGFTEIQDTTQKRVNYWVQDFEFAVKWSADLGFHYEAEVVVDNEADAETSRNKLISFVTSLGLPVLTKEEFREICEAGNARHRNLNSAK